MRSECRKLLEDIHGYSHISHEKTWDIVQNNLPVLRKELEQLLA